MSRPLRILVGADVPPDPNAGAAGTVVQTNQALRELGHEVDEIWARDLPHRVRHGNLHYLLELPRGYECAVEARCAKRTYDVIQLSQPYAWRAARAHRRAGRAGVFINRSHGLESLSDAATDLWHRRLGVPENRGIRALLTPLLRAQLHGHIGKAGRFADGLIVPAVDIEADLRTRWGVEHDRIAVIPHGIHESFLVAEPNPEPERRLRLLYVGQFAFFKGPHILARVLNEVMPALPEVEMTWLCQASFQETARRLLLPAVSGRVTFVDWMAQEHLMSLYDRHGIFIFPSFYEGAGKACFEAMSRGLAVVTSSVGAMRDGVQDGRNGYCADVGDSARMVAAVRRLVTDAALWTRITGEARKSVAGQTWRRCAEQAVAFYDARLQARSRANGRPA
jgi:glycosyltransferase involved in cell wall biosynthesis